MAAVGPPGSNVVVVVDSESGLQETATIAAHKTASKRRRLDSIFNTPSPDAIVGPDDIGPHNHL